MPKCLSKNEMASFAESVVERKNASLASFEWFCIKRCKTYFRNFLRYFTSTVVIGTAFIVSLMYWLGITLGTVQYHWIPTLRSYVTIAGGKVLIW